MQKKLIRYVIDRNNYRYKRIKLPLFTNNCNKGDLYMEEEKYNIKQVILEILETILGSLIIAIGISLFLLPNQLSSGGIAGIATITYYLLNIPMGTTMLLINIPLFVFLIFKIGKIFFLKSVVGTISLSIFIDFFDRLEPLTGDRFLACIYGGIIIGIRNCNNIKSRCFNRGKRFSRKCCKKVQADNKSIKYYYNYRYSYSWVKYDIF